MIEIGFICLDQIWKQRLKGFIQSQDMKSWVLFLPLTFERWFSVDEILLQCQPICQQNWCLNPVPLLSSNRRAGEAVWQFTLLHVSVWLGREIWFCFQASVVLSVFNAVQSHIWARGSPAQAALAVSLVMRNKPFASPLPCWCLLSKHEHLPLASNPSPGWYWSTGFKAGLGFQSLLGHIGPAVWHSGHV